MHSEMNEAPKSNAHDPILGCLIGTAVGDSIGLPSEGLSRRRVALLHPGPLRHRMFLGRGLVSDDTEHTVMVAKAFCKNPNDVKAFQRSLAWSLRWWLIALPAGIGMATAKAILRLWLGFSPRRSGVYSAGNGPAMRSAIIGVLCKDDPSRRREYTTASCHLTHTDSRALEGALLVSEAAALAADRAELSVIIDTLRDLISSEEMRTRFSKLESCFAERRSVAGFVEAIGCEKGVSGFAPNTVAVAIYAWLHHRGDFKSVIESVVACGGDTDTVAAIVGGIYGAEAGKQGIPNDWVDGIGDWPLSVNELVALANTLSQEGVGASSHFQWKWVAIPLRNLCFLIIVLSHGFRRLFPPY